MARTKAILFGNSKFAEVNHYYLTHDSAYEVVAFTVDGAHIREGQWLGLPVVPFEEISRAFPPQDYAMALPMGLRRVNELRAERFARARQLGYRFVNYISSKAVVWPGVALGENCFVYENVVVKPFAVLGDNVMIEAGSLVGHHVRIEDHCFLGPHSVLLGDSRLGAYSVVGANATIREGVTIGARCILGAGAVITRNTRPETVYVASAAELMPGNSRDLSGILDGPLS